MIDVEFPTPVVVTDVTVQTDPNGDITVTNDGEPSPTPNVPGTSPPAGPGEEPPTWWCCLLSILCALIVISCVAAYGLGYFEPLLPRYPLVTLVVVLLATLLIVLLWRCACRCARRAVPQTSSVSAPTALIAVPVATPRLLSSVALRGGARALGVLRRYARPARHRRRGRRVLGRSPSSAAIVRSDARAVPGTTMGLPRGRLADKIRIRGSRASCGRVSYVDASAWRAYAAAVETNAFARTRSPATARWPTRR